VRRNGCYVLNGVKRFITHGSVGEIFVVTAVTDRSQGTKGISSFILTKPTNDLDVDTLRALEDALLDFSGCAVVITHDRCSGDCGLSSG